MSLFIIIIIIEKNIIITYVLSHQAVPWLSPVAICFYLWKPGLPFSNSSPRDTLVSGVRYISTVTVIVNGLGWDKIAFCYEL